MKLRVTTRARGDLDSIFNYLNERSPRAAVSVMRAFEAAAEIIATHPEAALLTSIPGVRAKTVLHYRYVIFYRVASDAVELLHVRHGARARPVTLED